MVKNESKTQRKSEKKGSSTKSSPAKGAKKVQKVQTNSAKKTQSDRKAKGAKATSQKVSDNDRMVAMFSHLLGIVISWGWLAPLVIYLIKKDSPGFVKDNARHALNFQISMILYAIISGILVFVFIGIALLIILAILALVAPIIASIRAYEGEVFTYPLEIEFIKR